MKGQVEPFFADCSVSNKFFKPSIWLAEVSLHEPLLAQPFIDFRGANGFELGNFCHHPIYSKIYTADQTCGTGLEAAVGFFCVLKIVHLFLLLLSLLVSL